MGVIRDTLLKFGPAQRFDFWWRAQMKMFHKGEAEFHILRHIVDPNRNSVDVGAAKGIYSSWLQKYTKHVYAYEPNPENFRFLNYAKGNITVTNCAISNKAGMASFRIEKIPGHKPRKSKRGEKFWYDNLGGSLRAEKIGSEYVEFQVETRRLDDENLENVGFMKIDVEGHEFEVLEGARRTLERNRSVMLIEIEERHNGRPIAEALAEVEALGYSGFAYTPDGLKSLAMFDTAKHCDARNYQDYYIFNFIFFPRKAA
ncbi:MAG: FkbM family methyltransferase [SAR324 cluster bacterium]|nr:FkbM family methyltransferase [SAR324 cluster bacterium]